MNVCRLWNDLLRTYWSAFLFTAWSKRKTSQPSYTRYYSSIEVSNLYKLFWKGQIDDILSYVFLCCIRMSIQPDTNFSFKIVIVRHSQSYYKLRTFYRQLIPLISQKICFFYCLTKKWNKKFEANEGRKKKICTNSPTL